MYDPKNPDAFDQVGLPQTTADVSNVPTVNTTPIAKFSQTVLENSTPANYNPKNPDAVTPADNTVGGATPFTQTEIPLPEDPGLNIVPAPYGSTMPQGDFQSQNFRKGRSGWRIRSDGSAEFNKGLAVSSLNIPDSTTANSFHVDTSGNAWWGTNVATGSATAPASILNTGVAKFTSGTVGGFSMSASTLSATNFTVTSGAANVANLSIGTGSNLGGLNSGNAGSDIAFWAGNTFANRATAPFRVDLAGNLTATSATITGTLVASNSAFLVSFTAGENIAAGNPVCVMPVPTADVTFDKKTVGSQTAATITQAFTVAANSNRVLVVGLTAQNVGATISTITYNGVGLSKLSSQPVQNAAQTVELWFLSAPATGANNLVISSTASNQVGYNIYSYYNVSQSGQPEVTQSATQAVGSGGTQTLTLNALSNGALVFGVAMSGAASAPTGTVYVNNTDTNTGACYTGDSGIMYPPVQVTESISVFNNSGIILVSLAPVSAGSTSKIYKTRAGIPATVNTYVGIANETQSSGASTKTVVAGVDSNQSGLTPGTQYYLGNTAGTFSSSVGTVTRKAGIALSTTAMLVTNIW